MRFATRGFIGSSPRKMARLAAGLVLSGGLAACAQAPIARTSAELGSRNIAALRSHEPAATSRGSYGIASFYSHGRRTASGERFNPHELTAAHRSLPFGTHLRVTDVASGRSVTVRVNDRGPFVRGRVVDVSYAAARQIGLTGHGIAKVKVEVVQQ
jgi:peptidoglycan lytic transglycosylase